MSVVFAPGGAMATSLAAVPVLRQDTCGVAHAEVVALLYRCLRQCRSILRQASGGHNHVAWQVSAACTLSTAKPGDQQQILLNAVSCILRCGHKTWEPPLVRSRRREQGAADLQPDMPIPKRSQHLG